MKSFQRTLAEVSSLGRHFHYVYWVLKSAVFRSCDIARHLQQDMNLTTILSFVGVLHKWTNMFLWWAWKSLHPLLATSNNNLFQMRYYFELIVAFVFFSTVLSFPSENRNASIPSPLIYYHTICHGDDAYKCCSCDQNQCGPGADPEFDVACCMNNGLGICDSCLADCQCNTSGAGNTKCYAAG